MILVKIKRKSSFSTINMFTLPELKLFVQRFRAGDLSYSSGVPSQKASSSIREQSEQLQTANNQGYCERHTQRCKNWPTLSSLTTEDTSSHSLFWNNLSLIWKV